MGVPLQSCSSKTTCVRADVFNGVMAKLVYMSFAREQFQPTRWSWIAFTTKARLREREAPSCFLCTKHRRLPLQKDGAVCSRGSAAVMQRMLNGDLRGQRLAFA